MVVNRRTAGDWIAEALDLKTLLLFSTLLIGWVGNWYSVSGRVSQLELRTSQLETRLNKDMVPRAEEEVRNAGVEKRLDNIETTLVRIEQKLEGRR